MATSFLIDTHRFIEDLRAAGFTQEQAAGLTRALQRTDLNHLPARADLKAELKDLETRLVKWIVTVVGVAVAILALLVQL
jgi:hypothetical protein